MIEISEDTLKTAAGNESRGPEILSVILSHNMKTQVGEDTLKAAASNERAGGNVFWSILSHNIRVVISTEVMDAMAEDWDVDTDIMNMLMDHGNCEVNDCFESREEMMRNGVKRGVHYHGCKLEVTRRMKEAAIRWDPDTIDFLNAHKRPNVTFIRSTMQDISEDLDS